MMLRQPNPTFIDDEDSDIFNNFLNNNLELSDVVPFDLSAI